MLPPSGGAPIEVTREVLESEQAAGQAEAAPVPAPTPEPAAVVPEQAEPSPAPVPAAAAVVPANDGSLPPDTAPAAEILSRCEQIILAYRVQTEEKLRAIETAWLSKAGPAVRLVHRTKAYRELTDGNGKPYKSFQRWAQERCGISRPHAYRMVSEEPVRQALAPVYAGPLTTRQVDVLAPVLRQHGEDAVRRVWSAAESTGGTSAQQLLVKREVLELTAGPEDYEPPRESAEVTPAATLAQMHKAVAVPDRAVLRQAAADSPNTARLTMMAALKLASDLQAVLDELGETNK
jgi:hypothetical protein